MIDNNDISAECNNGALILNNTSVLFEERKIYLIELLIISIDGRKKCGLFIVIMIVLFNKFNPKNSIFILMKDLIES